MIAFNKYYNYFNFLSGILILCSLILLIFKGLNFGIDFKGGTLIELRSSDNKINVSSLFNSKVTVFGNLPYNISTEILSKWITNSTEDLWFNNLILMFQKEVADRIIAKFNTSNYGRLSIISNWKLNVEKICDIKPDSFSPRPKIDSSLLLFSPKKNFFKIKDAKNLEKVTRIFFNHRRKMIKKPFNQLFNGNQKVLDELNINLNLRPQNLDFTTYYKLTEAYEKLGS